MLELVETGFPSKCSNGQVLQENKVEMLELLSCLNAVLSTNDLHSSVRHIYLNIL